MSVLNFSLRAVRKVAVTGNKALGKASSLASKVERKATRILDGVDFSVKVADEIPFEQMYYSALPHVLPAHASMPAVGAKPNVTLLIPSLDNASFFGGTATALVAAGKFANATDRKLRIVQTLKTGQTSEESLSKFFKSEGIDIPASRIKIISIADRKYNIYGYISSRTDDIYIASAWWDVKILSEMPLSNKFIYLIQDFEPIFYNNSDQYALAEATYRLNNFIPLCNTKLMSDFMKDRGYEAFKDGALFFEPAVSRLKSGARKNKSPDEKKVMFLYGRPNVHRNLFYTALDAINRAFKNGYLDIHQWEIYMAGQDNVPNIKLPSGISIKNLGKMEMKEYINFSKTVDIAISPMMAPHPNYPTLEFASIGTQVVTTKYANKTSLENYTNTITACDIDAESMAEAINEANKKLQSKEKLKSNILESWDDSLDNLVKEILEKISA